MFGCWIKLYCVNSQYSKLGAVTALPYYLHHPYDGEIMQIFEALQCKNIIRHEEVSRILEHMSGGESVGDVVFGTMYLAHRGSEE